jgi:murein DD-endopeptidase MepM/ murein hydrolase activator NlpD
LAAAPGTVVAIRRINASGLEVELRHEGGVRTRYAHLGSLTPALAEGKRQVAGGERLGRVGRTGITRGTHLHFEVTIDDVLTDAAPILGILPCRKAAD